MSGQNAFKQIVAFADRTGVPRDLIKHDEYEQWKKDFIWEALHGIRYGQSFCNHFNIEDNHLFYNTGSVEWADEYIRRTYLA